VAFGFSPRRKEKPQGWSTERMLVQTRARDATKRKRRNNLANPGFFVTIMVEQEEIIWASKTNQ